MQTMMILTALAVFLSAQDPAKPLVNISQLTEPREQSANAVQPPDQVMDLIGIRPGLIIGEVGASQGRVTVHLAARVGDKGRICAGLKN